MKDERSLIDAAILCKVLITFETYFNQFSKYYHIKHIGHVFWYNSTFQLKYSPSSYTFEVHTSDFGDQPEYIKWRFKDIDRCDKNDISLYAGYINAYIDLMFKELNTYAPLLDMMQ